MWTMCYNYLISCIDAMAKTYTTISPGKNLAHLLGSNSKQMNMRCQSLGSTVKCTVMRRIGLLLRYIAWASIVESFQLRNENVFCFFILLFYFLMLFSQKPAWRVLWFSDKISHLSSLFTLYFNATVHGVSIHLSQFYLTISHLSIG